MDPLSLLNGHATSPQPIASYPGEISPAQGWTFHESREGELVYIPFEGYYESKGGRVQSPKITLDKKTRESAFYQLRFQAKAKQPGYWWVDLFDKDGNPLPDVNSALYGSDAFREYEEIFPAEPGTAAAQIAFVTKEGVSVRNVELRRVSIDYAATWCDKLYAELPQIDLEIPDDAFEKLPRSRDALRSGRPWRILMLGDSIVNDAYTSNFTALVKRDFPKCNLEFLISVRGSTGCWYYQDPKHFKTYVAAHKPDLLLIGGISNAKDEERYGPAEESMVTVIEACQQLGSEVAVTSPPPSYEWRDSPDQTDWDVNFELPNGMRPMRSDYQRNAANRTGAAFWDLTTGPCDAIATSRKPLDWFKRDGAHNDNHGKQLIGQTLAAYFRSALPTNRC